MDRLLRLMLFVYYKYTVHMLNRDVCRGIDITIEELEKGCPEVAAALKRAKHHVDIASKQRKPVLVDQDGQPFHPDFSLP